MLNVGLGDEELKAICGGGRWVGGAGWEGQRDRRGERWQRDERDWWGGWVGK